MIKQVPYNPKAKIPLGLVILKKFFSSNSGKNTPVHLRQISYLQAFDLETSFEKNCLVTKPWMFDQRNNKLCTGNELKCCMGLTLLSEGLKGFWLCEFLGLTTVCF